MVVMLTVSAARAIGWRGAPRQPRAQDRPQRQGVAEQEGQPDVHLSSPSTQDTKATAL
jgi:hypothetical protein